MNEHERNFWDLYYELFVRFPLICNIDYVSSGIPRWRLSIIGKNMVRGMSQHSGNMNFVYVEAPGREELFEKAFRLLKEAGPRIVHAWDNLGKTWEEINLENIKKWSC